ncbi:AAA family ATPase [Sphingobacteriales bacterium UPWRP_1]|nr:AAA family ATPase [Sphingobacteriales bacterium UPWRP_1]
MAESIKLSRINEMLQNPKFQQNVERLQTFKIYPVKSEFPDELVLPVILSKLDHELLSAVSSQLHRFASLILKADGKVTPEEEEMLKKVWELTHKPKKAVPNVKQTEVDSNESLDDVIKELNELIGLKNIKEEIKTLINFLKVQKVREEKGLATQDRALHSVFMGPPGTGKTTIARLVGRIYKHLGILKRGHLVETDRAGLVAGYIGQTALKVDEVVKAALDGVLFIDEAYALSRDGEDKRDFGAEAIETLLKRMEDYRKQLVVIVAGYPDEMETFIKSNPGLQSRFNRYFFFNHYSPEELVAIFKQFAAKADFKLTEEAEEKLLFIFEKVCENRPKNFGNARAARNLFEQCIERQANRIVSIAPLTEEILINLTEEDIPPVNETVKSILVFDPKKEAAKQQQQQPDLTQISKVLNTIVPPQQEEEQPEAEQPEAKQPDADKKDGNNDND